MAKVTQQEIATRLGVSRSTVAAALNPASTIKLNEATRERILKAAQELNYRPDRHARIMRGGRSGLIGILHYGGLLQVAAERAAFAASAIRQVGYEVIATDLSWMAEAVQAACTSLLDEAVEGVIVAGMTDSKAAQPLSRFREAGVPVVTLSGNPLPWGPHFRGDTRQAMDSLTRHLLAQGHRRLALMTPFPTGERDRIYLWSGSERVRGFETALREAGGQIVESFSSQANQPEGIVITAPSDAPLFDPFIPGVEGMRHILARPDRPTAVLCSNDELAFGALSVCREHGVSVPGDIALTGYDDTAMGRYSDVPITTVRQPNQRIAEAAVEALLALIKDPASGEDAPTTLFPCELILRRSSQRSNLS